MTEKTLTSMEVARKCRITFRQLDSWVRAGYLADLKLTGTGGQRSFTSDEVKLIERIAAFVHAGVRPSIAAAIARGDVEATNKLVRAMEKNR